MLCAPGAQRGSRYLDGAPHLLVRESRDAHLEGDSRQAAECFVYVEEFFGNSFGIAYKESAFGTASGVELGAGGGRPAALLGDLGEGIGVGREEVVGRLLSPVGEETNRVEADRESIARMTGATAGLAIDRECPDR